jgi:hypothetical protein
VAASFLARALSSGHLQVQTHGNLQALLRAMALQSALMKMTTETKIRTVWERDRNHHLHSGYLKRGPSDRHHPSGRHPQLHEQRVPYGGHRESIKMILYNLPPSTSLEARSRH